MPSRGDIYATIYHGINAVNRLSVDEGGGAVTVLLSSDVTYDGVAAAWQAALNGAGGLSNTYTVGYDSDLGLQLTSDVSVDWEWLDGAAAFYGFSSATESSSTTHNADLVPEGAIAGVTMACAPVKTGEQTRIASYRHGRVIATGYGRHSLWDVDAIMSEAQIETLQGGYCSGGTLRVYQSDDTNAYSSTNPDGYIEGAVYGISKPQPRDASEAWWDVTIRLAVPHG